MNTNQADQVLDLSPQAMRRAFDLIQQKMLNGSICTSMNVRDNSIEWHFDDGSFVEIEVLRDFNDNMNPVAVVVTEWIDEPTIDSFYTIASQEKFEVK